VPSAATANRVAEMRLHPLRANGRVRVSAERVESGL
jgi:hypothetical protein